MRAVDGVALYSDNVGRWVCMADPRSFCKSAHSVANRCKCAQTVANHITGNFAAAACPAKRRDLSNGECRPLNRIAPEGEIRASSMTRNVPSRIAFLGR